MGIKLLEDTRNTAFRKHAKIPAPSKNNSELTPKFSKTHGIYAFYSNHSFAQYLNKSGLYDTEYDVIKNFDHLCDDVRLWLHHHGYKQAEPCLDFMLETKKGSFRKDKITPSAVHEVTQAIWFITCLEDRLHARDPEGKLSAIFVHDLGEDYGIMPDALEKALVKKGASRGKKMNTLKKDYDVLSKRWGKIGKDRHENDYEYSNKVQKRPNTSVVKKFDRSHNIMTSIGVQHKSKISDYIAKTLQLLNDDVADCIKRFPDQKKLYLTLQHLIELEAQICRYHFVYTGKKITGNDDLDKNMPKSGFRDLPNGLHPLIVPAERIRKSYFAKNLGPDLTDTGDSLEFSS